MALPSREPETSEFDRIAPAVISPAEDRDSAARRPAGLRSAVAGAGLLILCLTAVAVVFVLPKWVTPVRLAEIPVAAPLSAPQGAAEVQPASKARDADPAERAQQARLRLESQDALAEMLAAQKALQPMHAEVWAAEAYAAGLAKAEAGHQAYRTQQFEETKSRYAEALATFRQLLEQSTQVFAAAMERGEKALQEGDSATATQAFETALLIRPSDAAAAKGARRARTLDA